MREVVPRRARVLGPRTRTAETHPPFRPAKRRKSSTLERLIRRSRLLPSTHSGTSAPTAKSRRTTPAARIPAARVRMRSARIMARTLRAWDAYNELKRLARPRGVEPLTPRSVVWCSIQLSYGRLRPSEPAMVAATTTPAAPENARRIEGDAISWAGARKRPAMLPDNG
jgi:hypothetical protein